MILSPSNSLRCVLIALALISGTTAFSQTTWNPTAGGSWNTLANWSSGIPTATTAANFGGTTAQTITLDVATASALGLNFTTASGAGAFTFNAGTPAGVFSIGASGITTNTANVTINPAVALTANQTWSTNGTGTITVAGVISGAFGITKDGTGTLVLSGTNTFSGAKTVTAGVLRGTAAGAFGGAGALNLNGGSLDLFVDAATTFTNTNTVVGGNATVISNRATAGAGVTHTLGTLSIGAFALTTTRGTNSTSGTGGVTFGATTLTGSATFSPGANSLLNLGAVSGAFALNAGGTGSAGTTVLTAASSYSGGTNLLTGTGTGILQVNNNSSLGTGPVTITTATATRLSVSGGVTVSNAINFPASGSIAGVSGFGLLSQNGTGQATITSNLVINSTTTAGGHFQGGTAAGNELVLTGAISGTAATINNRIGRVIFSNATSTYSGIILTSGTLLPGITNGIPIAASLNIGTSGNASLNLNGFNQTVASITMGDAGGFNAAIVLGANTLTINGNLSSTTLTTQTQAHTVTATPGGTINFGSVARNISLTDNLATEDLTMTGVSLATTASINKTGAGSLILRNSTVSGQFNVNQGMIAASSLTNTGTATFSALGFTGTATTIRMNIAATGGDVINGGTVTAAGTNTFALNEWGGQLAVGTYPLIGYTGTSPGLSAFSTGTLPGRVLGTLTDTGTAIALNVTGNDTVTWTGATDSNWNTTTNNWVTTTGGVATPFQTGDYLIFPDSGTNTTITTAAATTFNPGLVTFTNTSAKPYTIQPNITIAGLTTNFVKSGNGTVTLNNPNTYAGSTTISDGTLILNATTGTMTATSGISVAAPATFRVIAVDTGTTAGTVTISRSISGAGTVEFNPRFTGSTNTTAMAVSLTGTNNNHTGTLRLLAPTSGTYRLSANLTQIGTGPIEVQNGAQFFTATGGLTYNNPISIRGTGYADSAGNIGALRLESGTVWAGPVTIDAAGARIGAHNGTGTIAGNISGGPAEYNATNFNNSYTVILTGNNSYSTTVIGGQNTQTAGVPSMRLNIGNGGTTGTLGTGAVTINGDGANGILGFDRSNGYTLAAGQTITGAGSQITRTFVDLDTTGATFADGGNTITLGAATALAGGNIRIGQSRSNAIATASSTWTTEVLRVSSGQNNATFNIGAGATINANVFSTGEAAGMSGTVNQSAGAVNVTGQLRLGHFGTNTSVYNMTGGTLTMTGPSSTLTPSTSSAGGASATGDNNINAAATPVIVGGGIYLGIDGTGIFNQSSGTVTTNWIVLDNRGNTSINANMPTGIDAYNLTAGTLNFRSTWGLIGRNDTHQVTFGGGTVRVDNTGTGGPTGNTGANITIPLDAFIRSTASTTTTLDTNGTGNGFSFLRDVTGTGTFTLTGGGTINFSTSGTQMIAPVLNTSGTGANITKLGTGATTLSGSMSGYAGNILVSGGQLNVPNDLGAGNVTVNDGATLSGEPLLVSTLTLGSTAGGANLLFNPATTGMITASTLATVGGTPANLIFSSPPSTGLYPVIQYTSFAGTAANFTVPGTFRTAPAVINDTGASQIQVNFTAGANLVWTGVTSSAWNINTTQNWNNITSAINPDVFYSLDSVTFPDGPTNNSLTLTGLLNPSSVTFSNTTATPYTITSTAGNQITGGTGISKTGNGTVTLNGPNLFRGVVNLSGGTLAFNGPTSLGDASVTNTITMSAGSRLSYTGATAFDLGVNRTVNVTATGNSISHNNATAATITLSGNLTGAGAMSFHSNAAGSGTFILNGNNSGYTGDLSIDSSATAAGLTTLRFDSQSAIPSSGTIVVNYPAGATGTGPANTLNLQGNLTIPVNLPITMTSFLTTGNVSQRTQINVPTGATATINAPMILSGNTIIQLGGGGNMVLNGNITGPGFSNVFFTRGGGTFTVNGTITLPATATIGLTDSPTTIVNSTGNVWGITTVLSGSTLRLGANNALAVAAILNIGQNSDASNSTFDMNGFSQVVNGLTWVAGNANSTRGIINNSTTLSTLTIDSATNYTYGASTGFTGGLINGNIALVKTGSSNQTLAGLNNFTGNVSVNNGTLTANAMGTNTTGPLGHNSTSGRTVTVASAATLSFTSNNIFGSGVGNTNLPALTVAGTLSSTRYNAIGDLTLNGGTLTQASTDSGGYEGFQFRGNVTVGGAAVSTISTSASKANHLNANTIFNVADATGSTAVDLLVSSPLRNQSADYSSATGSLTKTGAGTMQLTAANVYSGGSTVTAGILSGTVASAFGTGAITLNGGTLDLSNDAATTFGNNLVIAANSSIIANRATTGAAVTHTLGTLSIGAQTLATTPGANVSSGTAGVTFGNTTLTGNSTFAPAAGTLVSLGIVTGTGSSLTQNGTGTTQLTLANTYTGNTNIVTGTLAMTGNASFATSPVITVGTTPGNGTLNVSGVTGGTQLTGGNFTLASGQTLAGHGTVAGGTNGLAIPTGATLAPGTSAGTLTINANVILGGVYVWEMATAGTSSATPPANGISSPTLPHLNHDMVMINGTANVDGMTINLLSVGTTGFDKTQYYSWQILTSTGTLTGTPVLGSVAGTDFSNFGGFMSVVSDANSVYVNYSPVPEPTLMFAIAGLVGVGGWIRSRKGKRVVS